MKSWFEVGGAGRGGRDVDVEDIDMVVIDGGGDGEVFCEIVVSE